ncbi:putative Cytochrome c subfamily [Sterolibacterium denitrificans]|uniref:Cytochrome c subfamily n=2 Tax=Sterolibacterium denitrificans TaxID=157592 RepID=A0A7Z7HUR0_9PROT|nr:putative Cytochrome c subfamily [Sterolibacterium denitrificans]
MANPMRRLRSHPLLILRTLLILTLLSIAVTTHAATPKVQTIWQLLDYLAVDYAGAVDEGRVINAFEYAEMQEFSANVSERLAELPSHPQQATLRQQAKALQQLISDKSAPTSVARQARSLAEELLQAYPVPRAPQELPDLSQAAALYQSHCASCHGATGGGDGPQSAGMDPPPIAFTDLERARQRSLFALQQVIERGLEGTAMTSYAHLSEAQRWALAFYIGQFAFDQKMAERGEKLWRDQPALQAALPDPAAFIQAQPASLAGLSDEAADALTAYLRRHPERLADANIAQNAAGNSAILALARQRLQQTLDAYAQGQHKQARDMALSAYLDGVEPIEPLLRARDPELLAAIEAAMLNVRGAIGTQADQATLQNRVSEAGEVLDRIELVLTTHSSADTLTAFTGALTILLREGLEALLIVVAMIAFLKKAGRPEALAYVHGGWIGALLAGGATWFAATHLVEISGASREVTEGLAALFAVVVLISVGIWMHGKSQADAWQRYIHDKLSHALSRGSAWFLFMLAFIVVYREAFETVLFYAALWSQGEHRAILLGAAVACLLLALVAWLILRYSRRLPFGQFFAASAVLVAVLAVVLAGKGVAALQEAGWLPVSLYAGPRFDLLGLYPTLQGVSAQVLTLLILLAGFAWNTRNARLAQVR